MELLINILKDIQGTITDGIYFLETWNNDMKTLADAGYAQSDDSRSTSGVFRESN